MDSANIKTVPLLYLSRRKTKNLQFLWKYRGTAATSTCFLCFSDNPHMVSYVLVTIQVLDVNDNIPAISGGNNAIIVCEGTKNGQVGC